MIYIPTLTTKLRHEEGEYENVLYSPNKKLNKVFKGKYITIWDNYTFYLKNHLRHPDRFKIARDHYLWLINFIENNWQEGITLITPDVDWLPNSLEIEETWLQKCNTFPQLYVPNSWNSSVNTLNIVGYALRKNTKELHPYWNHCLGHIRSNLNCSISTYDAYSPQDTEVLIKS